MELENKILQYNIKYNTKLLNIVLQLKQDESMSYGKIEKVRYI